MIQKEVTANDILRWILKITTANKIPDIHINTGQQPRIRDHNWEIQILQTIEVNWVEIRSPRLSREMVADIIKIVVWDKMYLRFEVHLELDCSYQFDWDWDWEPDRYRVNCYIDSAWLSIAMRIIPSEIPTIDELWLWDSIKKLCKKNKWLILVTWPTWSGKSTNLASMIDYIAQNNKKHIITIEDPIEFAFKSWKCLINQREIWNSTKWFPEAMKSALREDPDVIMVWEMRDPETIKAAITIAETWHLVLSTLHTNDSVQSIDRMVDTFPSHQQTQIRMQLSQSLIWVISQRLLPRKDLDWRIACREILIMNDAIKNLIMTWKTHQIYSVLEVSFKSWMILMDKYLTILYKKWKICKDTLLANTRDKEWMEMLIREEWLEG